MDALIQNVTPKMAEKFLERNDPRQIARYRISTARHYARDMETGNWDGISTIIISSDGMILDGQHRLRALILAGHTAKFVVVTGVNPDTYKHVDAHRPRSLAFRAELDAPTAAVCNYLALICLESDGVNYGRLTVERIEMARDFLSKPFDLYKVHCSSTTRRNVTSGPMRLAVLLRVLAHPESGVNILTTYNNLVKLDFTVLPKVMTGYHRRLIDGRLNRHEVFALTWRVFDPSIGPIKMVPIPDVATLLNYLRHDLLSELVEVSK